MSEPASDPPAADAADTPRLRRALRALAAMQARLAQLEAERSEPLAIVGTGCRLPGGADSPEQLWDMLRRGVDAVAPVPAARWDAAALFDPDHAAAGRAASRHGAFLAGVDRFDAELFGISPREAAAMDPQQRLFLEVSWAALEDAGRDPLRLAGSRTGVFVGVAGSDYRELYHADLASIDVYTGTATSHSVVAGRLSYLLDLRGPSVAIDTACSSSLVAVHLACQSLRRRECDLALAGGVNLMLSPALFVTTSKMGLLAADGRCRSFDAAASGIGLGEGCGVVALTRLSDALARGDQVLAVIRGSAVNQDGRSNGLTAPNGSAQRAVLREALQAAGIDPLQVGMIEAHGTGTPLGDPIEVEALGEVYGGRRPGDGRCALGSIKSNIGHLATAAGVAGLLKAALALHHGEVPPHLHFHRAHPHLALDDAFFVPAAPTPWPLAGGSRFAVTSSFGWSGTNAHVVLESAPASPPEPRPAAADGGAQLLALSAASDGALRETAERWAGWIERHPETPLADVCRTAAARAPLPHRRALVAANAGEMVRRLRAAAGGPPGGGGAAGRRAAAPPPVAFLYSGQGAQYAGMGSDCAASEPVFRRALERCDELLRPWLGQPLLELLAMPAAASRLAGTAAGQPALFALQVALTELWRAWGVEPAAVAGHSVGEFAAAWAAGVLPLEDAARLVAERGRLLDELTAAGGMAVVHAAAERLHGLLPAGVAVAALNGPENTVISGGLDALERALGALQRAGIASRRLAAAHAFHSPLVEPALAPFAAVAATARFAAPRVPFVSGLSGRQEGAAALGDPAYWCRQARQPVRFAGALATLRELGCGDVLVEIGPRPALLPLALRCLDPAAGGRAAALPSLRPGRPAGRALRDSLAALWELGVAADLAAATAGRRRAGLPPHVFERRRHWLAAPRTGQAGGRGGIVRGLYDSLADLTQEHGDDPAGRLLTFPPLLAPLPGFSWVQVIAGTAQDDAAGHLLREAQERMRSLLFHDVDFAACRRVLDFGCGYGSDLIALAERHPHLELDGNTLSPRQAEAGRRLAAERGVARQVRIAVRDSARDPLPGCYDLVFGFEVACHIRDKRALLRHLAQHLAAHGRIALADFAAATASTVEHGETSSYLAARDEWAADLAAAGLRLTGCVDLSREVGNFFGTADRQDEIAALDGTVAPVVGDSIRSYGRLAELLRRRTVSYVLLAIGHAGPAGGAEELAAANRAVLDAPVPYRRALADAGLLAAPDLGAVAAPGRYRLVWLPRELAGAAPAVPPPPPVSPGGGEWWIAGDGGGLAAGLAAALAARGRRVRSTFSAELAAPPAGGAGIVLLHGLDARLPGDAAAALLPVLRTIRGLAAGPPATAAEPPPRVWVATRGAQPVAERGAAPRPLALAQAPLWGLARVLALEHPELWGGIVDLDPDGEPSAAAAALADEIVAGERGGAGGAEDQVGWRGGVRWVPRLLPLPPAQGSRSPALRRDGAYLITGGLGALGLLTARHLAAAGAGRLLLLSRGGLADAERRREVEQIGALGASVRICQGDAADAPGLAALVAGEAAAGWPLRGVVHAAGVAMERPAIDTGEDELRAELHAKVAGGQALDQVTRDLPLDFFVAYSSIAAAWGSRGLAAYAAGNAFLDALAWCRRAAGRPALSVAWGPWSGGGMGDARTLEWLARSGVDALAPEGALAALHLLLGEDEGGLLPSPHVVAAGVRWPAFRRAYELGRPRPLLELLPGAEPEAAAAPPRRSDLLQRLAAAPAGERDALLRAHLRQLVAAALRLESAAAVPDRQPLGELGLDSLVALEVRDALEAAFGRRLSATLLLDHPTLERLARHLGSDVLGWAEIPPAPAGSPAPDAGLSEDQLAASLAAELRSWRESRTP